MFRRERIFFYTHTILRSQVSRICVRSANEKQDWTFNFENILSIDDDIDQIQSELKLPHEDINSSFATRSLKLPNESPEQRKDEAK